MLGDLSRLVREHWTKALAPIVGAVFVGAFTDTAKAGLEKLADQVFHRELHMLVLSWAPADCPSSGGEPTIGLDGCVQGKQRDLTWLSKQLLELEASGVRGFDGLPADLTLGTKDYNGVKNNVLFVAASSTDPTERARIGVGYDAERNRKDGCLRLYSSTKPPMLISPIMCLDTHGRWWRKDSDAEAPALVSNLSRISLSGLR